MGFAPATVDDALRAPCLDRVDARVLLQHVLGMSHAGLVAHAGRRLGEDERARFLELAARRARGEPVAYLVGWREFYGRRFKVDASVLIPRPETELLIDLALQRVPADARLQLLDLGTGSGNIALTLAIERPECVVAAVDASAPALAVARENAKALGVTNVRFEHGSWFSTLAKRSFDMIVSNPPYIAEGDPHLARGDLRFEPAAALRSGQDGLEAIRKIAAEAIAYLRPGGWLLFEHGHDQAEACCRLLVAAGFTGVMTERDLAELPRVSGGRSPR